MNITHPKEWQQFKEHKYEPVKTPEDKSYQTFLNSIFNEDGELNKIGGIQIPEQIIELCRVYSPLDEKEYIVYDVEQWGWFEDGTKTPTIHIQKIPVWKQYEWNREVVNEGTPTSPHKRTKYRERPENPTVVYELEWNEQNLKPLLKKITNLTRLYVYDLSKSGKGGVDGKIAVSSLKDLRERSFQELIEGTYLLTQKLQEQLKYVSQQRVTMETESKLLEQRERDLERERQKLNPTGK